MMRAIFLTLMLSVASVGPSYSQDMPQLDPIDMLRGLHRMQDSIANGDKASLNLKSDMISLLNKAFQESYTLPIGADQDIRPLILFALSGGGRTKSARMLTELEPSHQDFDLAKAVSLYVEGDIGESRKYFDSIDPLKYDAVMAPFLCLTKGTVFLGDNNVKAAKYFDLARLLAPDSLIEEVALRRLVDLRAKLDQPKKFNRVALQYSQVYLTSPFARQFVERYVKNFVSFESEIDPNEIVRVLEVMDEAQQISILLSFAREAALFGDIPLLSFVNDRLKDVKLEGVDALRKTLYSAITQLGRDETNQPYEELKAIEKSKLQGDDQKLLATALLMGQALDQANREVPQAMAGDLHNVDPLDEDLTQDAHADHDNNDNHGNNEGHENANLNEDPNGHEPQGSDQDDATQDSAFENFVTTTRDQLKAVDKILQETKQ